MTEGDLIPERRSRADLWTAARPQRPRGLRGAGREMRHVGPVRFVLDAGGDIEVRRGTSLAQARPALARLTGDPRLDTCELWVADRRLAPDHPAGTVPW